MLKNFIPELVGGDIVFVNRPELNATQIFQVRGMKFVLIGEINGTISQIGRDYIAEKEVG